MKKLLTTLLLTLALVALTACSVTEYGFYDSDAEISSHAYGTFATYESVKNNTSRSFSLTAKQWDGVMPVKTLTVTEDPLLDLDMRLSSGRMKLVVQDENGSLFLVAEATTDAPAVEAPVQTTLAAGKYRFLLVAEVAEESDFRFTYPDL